MGGCRPGGSGEVGKEQAGRRPGGAAAAPAQGAGGSRPKGGTACGPMPAPCRGMPRKRGPAGRGGVAGAGREAEAGERHPAGTGRGRHGRGYLTVRPPQAGAGCGRPAGQPARRAGLGAAVGRPYGGEAAGPAGLCPPDLAGCSKRRGFCTGTCTKICGGGSNPLHFGSRYDKINVESCSAAYFFLHTKKPEGGRPPCEALL